MWQVANCTSWAVSNVRINLHWFVLSCFQPLPKLYYSGQSHSTISKGGKWCFLISTSWKLISYLAITTKQTISSIQPTPSAVSLNLKFFTAGLRGFSCSCGCCGGGSCSRGWGCGRCWIGAIVFSNAVVNLKEMKITIVKLNNFISGCKTYSCIPANTTVMTSFYIWTLILNHKLQNYQFWNKSVDLSTYKVCAFTVPIMVPLFQASGRTWWVGCSNCEGWATSIADG